MRCSNTLLIIICLAPVISLAGAGDPPSLTDDYEISFGPQWSAIPGDPAFLLPINVSFSQPTVRINLILTYDPTRLTPTVLAPNIFVQSFVYDIPQPGRITLAMVTDLPPPPDVPPILGDTIVAWISFRVTSQFIGFDYLTTIDFFEDPATPYIDNYIVLENNDIIAQPLLVLGRGEIIIRLPRYGDINLNTYPWEIGDAVTFLNFFMGQTAFTRQQYANSDCNRDGIQASISDLVFLLRVISYDSLLISPPDGVPENWMALKGTSDDASQLLLYEGRCELTITSNEAIGGAFFTIDIGSSGTSIEGIQLDPSASQMYLTYSIVDNILRIAVVDWSGGSGSFYGGRLLSINYTGEHPLSLASCDFSDPDGGAINAPTSLDCNCPGPNDDAISSSGFIISGFPNPFNSAANMSFSLPSDGEYRMAIYDIMGRKIKTLFDEYRPAGSHSIVWDGTNGENSMVSSGTYFIRLQGDAGSRSLRLSLLK